MKEPDYYKDKKKRIVGMDYVSSEALADSIKNLTNPNFLGSMHMKPKYISNFTSIETLINNELESKIDKSLKNTMLNPITKILILLMIIFNLAWFLILFVF
ncbi:MAG: hypothetical protein EU539_06240 [Promethearchaeota archaeon]|nr:MAG: hypothetical protein EU539_06240 [Candidatus Lokiarchaeota archaeon]